MQLNNYLQINGGINRLHYVDIVSGPAHRPIWSTTVFSKFDVLPF